LFQVNRNQQKPGKYPQIAQRLKTDKYIIAYFINFCNRFCE